MSHLSNLPGNQLDPDIEALEAAVAVYDAGTMVHSDTLHNELKRMHDNEVRKTAASRIQFRDFLTQLGLEAKVDIFFDTGVESMEDARNSTAIDNDLLTDDVGLSPTQITAFRQMAELGYYPNGVQLAKQQFGEFLTHIGLELKIESFFAKGIYSVAHATNQNVIDDTKLTEEFGFSKVDITLFREYFERRMKFYKRT